MATSCNEDGTDEQPQVCSCSLLTNTTTGFDSTFVIAKDSIVVIAGESDTVINGGKVQFVAPAGNWVSYVWSPSSGLSCSDCPDPLATLNFTTAYELVVTDSNGYVYSFESLIVVLGDTLAPHNIYIPNIFTPNGDGFNDLFFVYGRGIQQLYITVKDGSTTVFEATSFVFGWDGTYNGRLFTDCKNFDYILDVTFTGGRTMHVEGDVTLYPSDGTTCPGNVPDCRFGNQFDGNGFNSGLNNGESFPC